MFTTCRGRLLADVLAPLGLLNVPSSVPTAHPSRVFNKRFPQGLGLGKDLHLIGRRQRGAVCCSRTNWQSNAVLVESAVLVLADL
jgi:hypothetical protein